MLSHPSGARTAPLSLAQQRLWFLEQLDELGSAYHLSRYIRLRGALDGAVLARALDGLVARHDALRTTFRDADGVAEQRIAPAADAACRLDVQDLGGLGDLDAELRRRMAAEVAAPFDLRRGPLFRTVLFRLAPDEHLLLFVVHHIVCDGWSLSVLAEDIGALYAGCVRGEENPLAPLAVPYAEFMERQRRARTPDLVDARKAYWRNALAGVPPLLELPTDRPRPARQQFGGASVPVEIDEALTAQLKALGERCGTTLFRTLLAAWALVAGRLSGQDDVLVGVPISNRDDDAHRLVGFFVDTVVVRVDLSGHPTTAALLERVHRRTGEARRHQEVPFEDVVSMVAPVRSLAHHPLIQTTFSWHNVAQARLELPGLRPAALEEAPLQGVALDTALVLHEEGGRIAGTLDYATALFDGETAERYVGYLRRVLQEMAADETRPVERLALLPDAERRLVVEAWNRTTAYPAASCIPALFQRQVARTPHATAVVFQDASLTYAELNARANPLAHHLVALGVGPDVRVAICAERGLEMVVALLAVLKAGGAYVPLDPAYPADRVAYMLADSAPAAVLAHRALRNRVETADVPVLELDAPAPAWADRPETDPSVEGLTPAHLAYVIYTSGSTGRPKGVLVPHENVARLFSATDDWFRFGEQDVWTLFHSFAFDFSVWEIWGALLYGGRLVVVPGEVARSPEAFYRLVCHEGVTVLNQTPSAFYAFIKAQAAVGGEHRLRHVVFGGEALDVPLLRPWFQANGDASPRLVNMYGITETTVHVTYRPLSWADVERAGASPIGERIPDLRAYLLDRAGEPVPVGVAGELYVGGAGLARGYLGRPELTADRFVADAFGPEPGARLYRTGDLGRRLPDGTLEFLGRADLQVKIRGFRIELGEIEARLLEHPGVREAVVLAREDAPADRRLVAYVAGDETAGADVLRAHLGETLPAYMVPAAYVRMERWPLTTNGKLDRKALPAPEGDAFAACGYEAPAGETEQAVAEIWAELLGVERVGRGDDFFALGGHSLLAVRVVSRVRQALGVEVAPADVFERAVLADFARGLMAAARDGSSAITPVDRAGTIPLSFAQQRLWFLEQLGGLGSTYHIPLRLRLRGALDRGALVRALDRIVARHEALRTTFPAVDGEPVQRIASADESGFRIVEHDLRAVADAEDVLRRLTADEETAPFDLEHGPLVRGRLVRLADDDHVLLLTMHHVVSDGWSTGVLHRELGSLYAAFTRGHADPLAPLPLQYADYAAWHRRWVDGDVLEAQARYWTETLAGAPELLELPADRPRPARQDFAGATVEVELDETLTAALRALSQRHGTTLFMTLLAGWAALLGRLSGQDDVVVGTPSANRGRAEVEELIGFFVNTLPVRVDLSAGPRVAELLERVKGRALEAQRHQDIPLEQVVERLRPARSLAYTPLFQVMFAWEDAIGALELPGLTVHASVADADTAKFDLSLALGEDGGRIIGTLNYASALFDRATVERWVGYLRRLLEGMAAGESQPVGRLALMADAERLRVVEEWNRTDAAHPAAACVHARFEAQVEQTPDAIALVFGDERVTYAALNARANRLAHRLRALGVGPDARVGICVERGVEMVVALLGVLKAGGAYVPLDPANPADRLRHVMDDSAPVALLVQAATAARFAGLDLPLLSLDADAPSWAGLAETNPQLTGVGPRHLAYVIYTSGSTGRPKGVMVEHGSVCQQVAAIRALLELRPGERSLQFASVTFDASVEEIFGALLSGSTLVLRGEDWVDDAGAFWARCQAHGVNVMDLPTRFWQLLAADPRPVPACVRLVVIGGEAVEASALSAWFAAGGHRPRLLNTYGPTESTVNATVREVTADPATWRSIGRPVPHTRAYLLDAYGQPVPQGVTGEIHVAGGQVARGYLGRPGLTAERFVPDPFGEPGARLYRTGDLGRWRADGTIEFAGRNDFQVKIRGFRIEPGEIEARLAEHPGVREAVVLAREDAPGEKRLVAYHVGDDAGAETLRAHLSARLPGYMVPAAYVRMDAWPLTSGGKVDRRRLPAPEGGAFAARGFEAPAGGTEQAVAAIWAELLGAERVGRHDHFFDAGGHSLLAVRAVSRVRQALGVEATVGDLFARPVLADFARGLAAAAPADADAIEPVDRTGNVALSFAQQRLWFLEQLGGLGSTYHVPVRLRLRGALDRGALVRALDRIVARHEALRTTFPAVAGAPVQRIAPAEESAFRIVEHDLRASVDAEGELLRLLADEESAAFDLEHGPLVRGRLVRMAPDDHVLLLTMHHVVSDGWSTGVLHRELGALYAAFTRGDADPLPPLPVQYADYAAWHRRWADGAVLEQQAQYWTETLAGAPELLELPTDRPRPARQDFAGATVEVALDAELTAALRALSQRHGTTLYMTLLAGWATLLGRLAGQDDVVVGTPSANRGRAEVEELIGFFVNMLPVRVDLSERPTVAQLLGRVKGRALQAQRNQDIPFEQVVERLRPARSLAYSPLFQVLFAWQDETGAAPELLPGLELAQLPGAELATAKFDLALVLEEDDGRIRGGLNYATALFDRATVERYAGYLRRVLREMADDDAQAAGELRILPDAERRLVVEEWNRTDAAYPADACIHALFEAQAERTPGALAVVSADESLTYAELNARANGLARRLRDRGVLPGARVALLVPRSVELVVAELAVLKAGAAYVPIDPAFPQERIAYMVADSGSAFVVDADGAALSGLGGVETISVGALDDGTAENLGITVPGDALAYVMYTSGSTGAPKGVMVPHRGIGRLVLNNGYAAFGPDDRVAFAANPAFDAATLEVWAPLLNGGRVVVIEPQVFLEPAAIARRLREQGVTALFVTTAVFNQFAASIPAALAGVRYLMTGGERADPAAFARVLNAGGTGTLIHCYGPTETTTFALTHEVRHVAEGASSVPLGRPIANTRVYVLDGRGEPVPVGVAGELYIGGDGVAHGYLDRPALTAERFVPDAFGGEAGARLYGTGDLARWLPDGTLEFLGRNDFQVKVRGFRIELGEIEARLAEHPSIREAVVLAREDAPGDKRLVAWYVAAEPVEAESLRRHVGERLPEHMVPAAFVWLEKLPLTPNGKLDRRALPAPEGDAFATRGYEAPAGEMEQALAGIWSEVLGVEPVGRRDHFFELGGHSLLAVRLVSRVRQALGVEAALGAVFQRPVLADFAQALAAAGRAELPPIEPVDRGASLPLSFAQQRLWFLEQSGDLGSTYHVPLALRLRGALDRDALLRALDRIVARHEVLRTTFGIRDGEPEQRIAPDTTGFHLVEQDLAGQGGDALERVTADEAAAPFDLERGPLVRGRLLRLAADDHVLLLTLHHVVVDEWSIGVLVDELARLYAAFRAGAADPLPALPVQYADYAAWQRRWVQDQVLEAQAGYWTNALAGAPALLELPADRTRPQRQDFTGASVRIELDAALTAGLKELGRRHGTTLFMTLLAGWATVLARLSGQNDVVIGTPSANRGRGEIEGLIGFFVNTLALRVALSARPTVAQLLEQVKRRALEAQQNQDIPFEQVVERLQPVRSLSHSPLFQVLFAWHSAGEGMPQLPGLELCALDGAADDAAKFDLSLGLSERNGTIAGEVTYATSLFDRETVERHLACLRRVLEQMVADDAQAVDRLPMLPDAERRRVLRAWNRTEAAYPREACIHELFEAQAERTPAALALVCGDEALTYAALNRRANRLAHHLRGLGVGPDARVGICVERGVEMVVAQLATLKAGGAYVPLDPSYPAERLACMLDDSAPQVLLTQAPLAERFRHLDVPVLDLAGGSAAWRDRPETNPARGGLRPEHLAYVIFTSGSTGRPKGVMLAHRNAVNFIAWGADAFRGKGLDRTLFSTSLNFDLAVFELFVPLHVGATVCLVEDALALHRGPADVTLVNTVPSALRALLDGGGLPAGVRTVNLAGEPLKRRLAERIFAETGVERLCNLYGPSETTTYSTWVEMRRGDGFAPHVGGPVANTQVYLLDPWGEPVPAGVVGELYIGGDGVARGYQGRPALTAERFVPDPFGNEPGARMYRTGDLGRWLPEGAIEFLGRNDHQVKIRGFRIELGEIEARLAEHPGVREAVVLAREDDAGERRLVAWWVGGDEVGVEGLRAHLLERLAEYMVPAAYVRLERLPLTPNGKLDRAALPAPPDDAYARRAYEAPVGRTEQGLAEIWSELLGLERVGRGDHFFELGGHSLLATRAASRMSERFGTRVPAMAIFAHAHLTELARAVDEARAAHPGGGAADAGMDSRISPFSVDTMSDDDVDTMLADLLSNRNDA